MCKGVFDMDSSKPIYIRAFFVVSDRPSPLNNTGERRPSLRMVEENGGGGRDGEQSRAVNLESGGS